MKKILLILLILFIALVGAGYFTLKGRIPSISNMFIKQVDLGIDETPDEIYSFYDEIGFEDNLQGETPKSGELVFEGGIDLEKTFTQSEINSWFSAWEQSWTGIPFQNLQVRLNPDGTVEASSLISIQEAESMGRTLGYTDEEINQAKSFLEYIPDPLPLYAMGTADITENDVNLDITSFKVAGFTLPSQISSAMSSALEDIIERARLLSDDMNIEKATVTSDGVSFKGKVPASVSVR